MNQQEERQLFNTLGRIEQHLEDLNGKVTISINFRDEMQALCAARSKEILGLVYRNKLMIVAILASGAFGGVGLLKVFGVF